MDFKYSFFLKNQNTKRRPVILKFNFGYKVTDPVKGTSKYVPLILSTGVKLLESEWDNENKRPIHAKDQSAIEEFKDMLVSVFNLLAKRSVQITPELLKSEFQKYVSGASTDDQVIRIAEYIEEKILESPELHQRTRHHYKVLKGKIEVFEEAVKKPMTTKSLDRNFYLEFQKHCKSQLNKQNSVWGVMKNLKATLNRIRRDYPEIHVFNPSQELVNSEKVQKINERKVFFDFEQIQAVIDYEPETESMKNVKLILLTLLFTGCRYSDIFKIKPTFKFEGNGTSFRYCQFISEKGEGKELVIPFLKPLEDAIRRNGGKTAYPISDVKFNKYVKELCKKAGLDHEVAIAHTNSHGRKELESKPLYEFVSSHIGRRSFISNLISALPITVLAKITGHSFNDREVIFQYDKKSPLQNAVIFVKELRRVCEDRPEDFPIQLV